MPGPGLLDPRPHRPRRPRRRGLRALLVVALTATGLVPLALASPARAAGAVPGAPVVATAGDGTTTVFVRAADHTLYRRDRDPATAAWGDWADTGSTINGNPGVGRRLDGRLEVFADRSDGHLWHQAPGKGGWGPWGDLGAPPGTTVVGTPVVVSDDNRATSADAGGRLQGNTDGRLELFVRGADHAIWHLAQLAPNGLGWSDWEKLDGSSWVGDPAAVVTGSGHIALVARTKSGHLETTAQTKPGTPQTPLPAGNWAAWTDLGAGYTGNPVLVANTYTGDTGEKPGSPTTGTLLQAFAKRGGNHPWTIAQSAPGTAAQPNGTWDTADKHDIGLTLSGPPEVAVSDDGRLSVFGVNANHVVVFRSQTRTLEPGVNATGIWNGPRTSLTGQKVRSVAVTRSPTGSFSILAVGQNAAKLFARDQLAAGTFTSTEGVWLDWSDLAAIGSDPCAGPGSLSCLSITNTEVKGGAMDLEDPKDAKTRLIHAAPDAASVGQRWSLKPLPGTDDGTFMIANDNGECVAEQTETIGPWHLRLGDCGTDAYLTKWYLVPVTTSTTEKPTLYRIHQAGKPPGDDYCLTALTSGDDNHNPAQLERNDCGINNNARKQTWFLGRNGAAAPGVLDLALEHAGAQCAADKTANTCTFQDTSTPAAYNAPGCVVGDILYNLSPDSSATYTTSWAHLTGSQWSVGNTLIIKFSDVFTDQLAVTHTWIEQDTTTKTASITVPPGRFGWIEYSPVARETIGYWQITLAGYSYTVPGHNLSYAKDNTEGKSALIVTHTATEPPTNATCKQ